MQLPNPPLPPGFIPPTLDAFAFAMFYLIVLELVLIALPGNVRNRVLETLLPFLRRPLYFRFATAPCAVKLMRHSEIDARRAIGVFSGRGRTWQASVPLCARFDEKNLLVEASRLVGYAIDV